MDDEDEDEKEKARSARKLSLAASAAGATGSGSAVQRMEEDAASKLRAKASSSDMGGKDYMSEDVTPGAVMVSSSSLTDSPIGGLIVRGSEQEGVATKLRRDPSNSAKLKDQRDRGMHQQVANIDARIAAKVGRSHSNPTTLEQMNKSVRTRAAPRVSKSLYSKTSSGRALSQIQEDSISKSRARRSASGVRIGAMAVEAVESLTQNHEPRSRATSMRQIEEDLIAKTRASGARQARNHVKVSGEEERKSFSNSETPDLVTRASTSGPSSSPRHRGTTAASRPDSRSELRRLEEELEYARETKRQAQARLQSRQTGQVVTKPTYDRGIEEVPYATTRGVVGTGNSELAQPDEPVHDIRPPAVSRFSITPTPTGNSYTVDSSSASEDDVRDPERTGRPLSSLSMGQQSAGNPINHNRPEILPTSQRGILNAEFIAVSNSIPYPAEQGLHERAKEDRAEISKQAIFLWTCILLIFGGSGTGIYYAVSNNRNDGSDIENPPSPSPVPETLSPDINPIIPVLQELFEDKVSDSESLKDITSPQYAAMTWISTDSISLDALDSPINDRKSDLERVLVRYSLAVFYFSLDGDAWFFSTGWLDPTTEVCDWSFVFCDEIGQVKAIDTENTPQNLRGKLPSELVALSSLEEIRLPSNNILGLDAIEQLKILVLPENQIESQLQDFLYAMTALTIVDLSSNSLFGSISSSIANLTQLKEFRVSNNRLSGVFPEISLLSSLQVVEASSNFLTGEWSTIFRDLPSLRILDLEDNNFGGSIEATISTLSSLETLVLDRNSISGTLATDLMSLEKLADLRLNRNSLEGTIPEEIGLLGNTLGNLQLQENLLSGSLPTQIGLLTTVRELILGLNLLTGQIPSQIGQLSRVVNLDLGVNFFNDTIPTELGQCQSLANLRLSRNELSGIIPGELASLKNLQTLYLEGNEKLTGGIPQTVCQFDSLSQIFTPCGVSCPCDTCSRCI